MDAPFPDGKAPKLEMERSFPRMESPNDGMERGWKDVNHVVNLVYGAKSQRDGSFRLKDELLIEMRVLAFLGEQFAVRAALDDVALLDDQDLIGLHDRAQAVCDDERRSAGEKFLQRALHRHFGRGV